MKNFMYLNMDFLESFMVQNNDGFPEQEELEENHSHTETEEDEVAKEVTKLIGGLVQVLRTKIIYQFPIIY